MSTTDPSKITKYKVFFSAPSILRNDFLIFKDPDKFSYVQLSHTPAYSSSLYTHPHPNQHLQKIGE